MEIETHRTIRALLVLPSILAYSAVIVYFVKDIGIDDIEKMRYIAQANMRFPFFILFISFILIKLRDFVFYRFYQNKEDYLDIEKKILKMDEVVFLRVINYIVDIFSGFLIACFIWMIAFVGFGARLFN